MSDILLLAGVAFCALSIFMAIIQVIRLQPPRTAAITFVLGIVLMFSGAYLSDKPFVPDEIGAAWDRVTDQAADPLPN